MRLHTAVCACVLLFWTGHPVFATDASSDYRTTTTVGWNSQGLETPVNQKVTPAGKFVTLPGVRPNALALSPDGRLLVAAGIKSELLVIDPSGGAILQHVPLPAPSQSLGSNVVSKVILDPNAKDKLSFTGLAFSPDGSRLYLANVNGDIKVFAIDKDKKVASLGSIPLPPANAPDRKSEIPAGIAVSRDGTKLYVALNLSNRLAELDAATGRVLRLWNVGVDPYDVVVSKDKIYVSNWGGRRPVAGVRTGPAGRGTEVRVDARYIASEGSISVIDLAQTNQTAEILTGLHACAMALSPNGRWLVVANAGSDTLSVIDTHNNQMVETIWAPQDPGDLFGAQPDALVFDARGKNLFVCNASQNAVAVFEFNPGKSKRLGLIPVGWFPGSIAYDARREQICVANIKDITTQKASGAAGKDLGFNTHQYEGSLSLVRVPGKRDLAKYTGIALANVRYPLLEQAKLPPRRNQPARPIPERVGEPSVFEHVIYIIKENRTYDQMLGDVAEGNGDGGLCIYGENVTPNQHKLARDFSLLDNTYCSGVVSADGHQWTDTGITTEYVERSVDAWPRSYPAGGGVGERDAMAYSPAGFIWDDVLAHGKTLCDFGEFTISGRHWKAPGKNGAPEFLDCYRDYLFGSNTIAYTSQASIPTLQPYIVTDTVGFDLNVPDVVRAAHFIKKLRQFEAAGNFPNFIIVWLPNDHTSGTRYGSPTPRAQVADNDLALGQIVEAVSHSKFWTNTCIFAVEDDPQDGWDHVSGYRTTAYLASPYTRRHAVVSTQYNQTSLLRTMELILGLPPMNQMDATATPMFDCFTETPDFTPFSSVAPNISLDEMNPKPKSISDTQLRKDALVSARLPFDKEDRCPDQVLNQILWRAAKGSRAPFPSWAVRSVDDDD